MRKGEVKEEEGEEETEGRREEVMWVGEIIGTHTLRIWSSTLWVKFIYIV